MKVSNKLVKVVCITLIFLLLVLFFEVNVAYARGGCFGTSTRILTPSGYKYIEQLHQTDRIIGFNLHTRQIEDEEIGDVQMISSPDYYLINGKIKVTGTHPFYTRNSIGIELIEVRKLKLGDQLLGENNSQIFILSINHIKTPITVYNLLSTTPSHNFYADGVLVHNKGGSSSGGGDSGARAYGSGHNPNPVPINAETLPGLILCLMVLIVSLFPFAFFKEIYNFVHFREKEFTNDLGLIQFTKIINSRFTNFYSIRYSKDDESWITLPALSELNEKEYQVFISRSELIKQIYQLFVQYQNDWTKKNFDEMTKYVAQPFYKSQHNIFLNSFGDNFDIVYQPEPYEIIPLSYRQEEGKCIFRVQISARMVNFELSRRGFVLSGEAYPRSFTEYWSIGVDNTKKCNLMEINQTDTALITSWWKRSRFPVISHSSNS